MCYQFVLHGVVPQPQLREVLQQVVVDHLEFPREDAARVDVAGVGFNGLVVAQDLGRGGRGHGRQQEAVPDSVSGRKKRLFHLIKATCTQACVGVYRVLRGSEVKSSI